MAVLASGGLLDALAAIRAGLMHLGGSDTDASMRTLLKVLVGTRSADRRREQSSTPACRETISAIPCTTQHSTSVGIW